MKRDIVFVPILLSITLLFLIFTPITHIECEIEQDICTPELQEKVNILKGSSFFFGNFEKKLEQNKFSDSIYIIESVKKKFPNTLKIILKQEQVAYSLTINEETKYIAKSGLILPKQDENRKIVQFDWKNEKPIIADNQTITEYHQKFVSIAQTLNQKPIENVKFIWKSDQEILLELPSYPLFIFDKDTIETQVKNVDTIISAKELEEIVEPILEIDMRFNLPVLRTSR